MAPVTLIIFVLVLILAFYLVKFIEDAKGQQLARVVIVVVAVLWALSLFGILPGGFHAR